MQAIISREEWEEYLKLKETIGEKLKKTELEKFDLMIETLRRFQSSPRSLKEVASIIAHFESERDNAARNYKTS